MLLPSSRLVKAAGPHSGGIRCRSDDDTEPSSIWAAVRWIVTQMGPCAQIPRFAWVDRDHDTRPARQLVSRQLGAHARDDLRERLRVAAVGHRIVHGGTLCAHPALIDDEVWAKLQALAPLAPLHQPHNLAGVAAVRAAFLDVPQVACFDTAFHRTQPAVHQHFAIPTMWHAAEVRRYGFHGLSYESIVTQLAAAEPQLARAWSSRTWATARRCARSRAGARSPRR